MPRQKQRPGVAARLAAAVRRPGQAVSYLRRLIRNSWYRLWTRGDHMAFYSRVMRSDITRKSPEAAVGTAEHADWLRLGQQQFDYLAARRLDPSHRMLEIGCGNLRAGWRFIEYLGPGAYTGADASPDIIQAARATLADHGLEAKRPELVVISDMRFEELPAASFDVVHAHSVFSHTPVEVVEAAFEAVRRLLKPGGFFDFTYNASADRYWQVLWEDYYYPPEMLEALAAKHGFKARRMKGWKHPQAKMRLKPE